MIAGIQEFSFYGQYLRSFVSPQNLQFLKWITLMTALYFWMGLDELVLLISILTLSEVVHSEYILMFILYVIKISIGLLDYNESYTLVPL